MRQQQCQPNYEQEAKPYRLVEEFKLRADLPHFYGGLGIEEFMDWMSKVERFFAFVKVPEDQKVDMVAFRFRQSASAQWDRIIREREEEGKEPITSWRRMKRMLEGRSLPLDYEQILFLKYNNCTQGQRTVQDYTTEFLRLSERNKLSEIEGQLVARYIGGLKPNLREKMGVHPVLTLADAQTMALKAELMAQERNRSDSHKKGYNEDPTECVQNVSHTAQGSQIKTAPVEGKIVGKKPMESPPMKNKDIYARPIIGESFKCNQEGHRSSDCPKGRSVNIVGHAE